jgi:hypothetical protein
MMATTCHGHVVNSQLVVTVEKGDIASRMSIADEELGICKVAVDSSGALPLLIAGAEAKAGDRIYAPVIDEAGKVTLVEGTVKGIVAEPRRKLVEVTLPVVLPNGTPLVDNQAHVVGMISVTPELGAGRNLALPGALVNQAQARAKSP